MLFRNWMDIENTFLSKIISVENTTNTNWLEDCRISSSKLFLQKFATIIWKFGRYSVLSRLWTLLCFALLPTFLPGKPHCLRTRALVRRRTDNHLSNSLAMKERRGPSPFLKFYMSGSVMSVVEFQCEISEIQ